MKILIFTHGTILIHNSGIVPNKGKVDWEELAKKDPSYLDISTYVPIKNTVKKTQIWKENKAEIIYMTPETEEKDIKIIKDVLRKHGFPEGKLLSRETEQEGYHFGYVDFLKDNMPDVWIDDDCESLGGRDPKEDNKIKSLGIKLIIVPEFGGTDHLPDDPKELLK